MCAHASTRTPDAALQTVDSRDYSLKIVSKEYGTCNLTTTLPLVRAAAIVPMLIWLRAEGVDDDAMLRDAGLPPGLAGDPFHPVSLAAAFSVLRAAALIYGPDFGCRVVADDSIGDLGMLALGRAGARNPRETLTRIARGYAVHGSHEQFTVSGGPSETVVRHSFRVPLGLTDLHLAQQYVATLVQSVIHGTGHRGQRILRTTLTPDPDLGLSHLSAFLDGQLFPRVGRTVEVVFANETLDRPYLGPRRSSVPAATEAGWAIIRGDGTLSGSIRTILPDLLTHGDTSVDAIAALAYMSRRTLQRRLTGEGTSVSGLIAQTRRTLAIDSLDRTTAPVGDIAFQLGYNSTSSFSRAVRRWTSTSPRRLRTA